MTKVTDTKNVELVDMFMVQLLDRVKNTGDGVDVKTQIDFFNSMVKWASIKNRIDPESGEGSKIHEFRDALKAGGGDSGRNPRTRKPSRVNPESERPAKSDAHNTVPQEEAGRRSDGKSQNVGSVANDSVDTGPPYGFISVHDSSIRS